MKQRRRYFGKPYNSKVIVLLIVTVISALLFSVAVSAGAAPIDANNGFNSETGFLMLWIKILGGTAVFISGVIFGFTNGGQIGNRKEKLHKGDRE